MSEQYGIIVCTLCGRMYKKYNKHDLSKVFGLSYGRSGNWNQVLTFVGVTKSEINKHLCTQCISDIVNEFAE